MLPGGSSPGLLRASLLGVLVVLAGTGGLATTAPPGDATPLPGDATPPTGNAAQITQEGTVVGRPSLTLSVPDNRVRPGQRVTLDVFVANAGDLDSGGPERFERRVTTARNVTLRVVEDGLNETVADAVDVDTGTVLAGSVPPGVSGPFTVALVVGSDLAPGRYRIPVEVTYEYTNIVAYSAVDSPQYRDSSRQIVEEVTLVVEEHARVTVEPVPNQSVRGDSGTVQIVVSNDGTAPATDVGVQLRADGSVLFFGDGNEHDTVGVFVGRLEPGASRTVNVTVGVASQASDEQYLLSANATYRSVEGVDRTAGPFRFGVPVNRTG